MAKSKKPAPAKVKVKAPVRSAAKAAPKKAAKLAPNKPAPAQKRKSFTIKAPKISAARKGVPMLTLLEGDSVASDILKRLRDALSPISLALTSQTAVHANHAEAARHGGGHYNLKIVSESFEGLGLKERQMWVANLLRDLYQSNKIHALSMSLKAPAEEPLPE